MTKNVPKTFREFREKEENAPAEAVINFGDITIFPAFDAKVGQFGHIIVRDINDKEESRLAMLQVFDVTETVDCDKKQIEEEYKKVVSDNYYIIQADDPKKLRLGFVVVKGDGCIWYRCHLNDWKRQND